MRVGAPPRAQRNYCVVRRRRSRGDNPIGREWVGLAVSRYSLLDGEANEHGDLVLTIEFDVTRGGWIIGLTSPPLYWADDERERVYSQVLMLVAAYENDETYEYLDCLLAIHFERLGLLYTGR
jgi:hypothetical protein